MSGLAKVLERLEAALARAEARVIELREQVANLRKLLNVDQANLPGV